MPTDETRRLLRTFGVAVTNYEDAVNNGAPAENIREAEAEATSTLKEIQALLQRLASSKVE
ncbi:MAG TPA: hypothetical protein VIB79_19600 [Candidatus Binatia bacterium]|jgi:hypothetical protein